MGKVHILLVEDNEGDIMLTREALNKSEILSALNVVTDGWEAVQFLEKKGKYAEVVTPDIILLDINLPKMNGHEVLHSIKNNPVIQHIPVIMLTTSSYDLDIRKCYDNHANCYITKPMDVNEFLKTIREIADFWLNFVKLPLKINNE